MHITTIVRLTSLLLASTFLLFACASSPQLYPNAKYKAVGKEGANKDIEDCKQQADQYVESSKGKNIAKGAGVGAVTGAAVGGVLGLFSHNVGGGALVGGAVGGTAGAAHGAMKPDDVKRNFVNECLRERGYKVLGWN